MGVYSTLDMPRLIKIGFPIFIYNFYKTGLFMEAFIWSCKRMSHELNLLKK